MKVAKQFRWEGAHRLPWHEGDCRNIHGHSYSMTVELLGNPNSKGMLIDFKEIKHILSPLVAAWDHATLIAESDVELLEAIKSINSKYFLLPFDSTSENLCLFVANYVIEKAKNTLMQNNIGSMRVLVRETESCYAEIEQEIEVLEFAFTKTQTHN